MVLIWAGGRARGFEREIEEGGDKRMVQELWIDRELHSRTGVLW